MWLKTTPFFLTETYLSLLYPSAPNSASYLYINGSLCPDPTLVQAILYLPLESQLRNPQTNQLLAVRTATANWTPDDSLTKNLDVQLFEEPYTSIEQLWDIFLKNGDQLRMDYAQLTSDRSSAAISDEFTRCYKSENIFLEEGVTIRAAILNAEGGPIYLGKNSVVSEGAIIQGPFALGEGAVIGQGAKIRPNCTIGPFCKVSGEVNNSILFGYSNKAHDGYLGNAVLGEWCNLGANTTNSNLKNDYTTVKLYDYSTRALEDSGQLFCGLFMGDYTKAGINTLFNTGTVVGVNVNVFGAGFQPKHIPSFTWGGQAEGFSTYRYEKALDVIQATIGRRQLTLSDRQQDVLRHIFEQTKPDRTY